MKNQKININCIKFLILNNWYFNQLKQEKFKKWIVDEFLIENKEFLFEHISYCRKCCKYSFSLIEKSSSKEFKIIMNNIEN